MIPAGLEGVGTLESVELWVASCALASPIVSSLHNHEIRRIGFVRVRCSGAEGFGEIAAMDQTVGTDPRLDLVLRSIEEQWSPRLFEAARARGGGCPPSHAIAVLGPAAAVDRQAAAALEMAVLDAELRAAGLSLARWLEVGGSSVAFGALRGIPADRSIDTFVADALDALTNGASRLRVKVDPSWALEPLSALRRAAPEALLQADANGSLGGSQGLKVLHGIDGLGLACIEEPLGTTDLAASASLAQQISTPLCLDETLSTPRVVRDALRYQACGVLCIKPGRLGGIRAALRALGEAQMHGVDCFVGGMFEAGLGRSALGALAGRPEATLIGDVVSAGTYLVEDPCHQSGPEGGSQPLFDEPGVGPWPDRTVAEVRWEHRRPGL